MKKKFDAELHFTAADMAELLNKAPLPENSLELANTFTASLTCDHSKTRKKLDV